MKLNFKHLIVLCIVIVVGYVAGSVARQKNPPPPPVQAEQPVRKPVAFEETYFTYEVPLPPSLQMPPETTQRGSNRAIKPKPAPSPIPTVPSQEISSADTASLDSSSNDTQPLHETETVSTEPTDARNVASEENSTENQTQAITNSEAYLPSFL